MYKCASEVTYLNVVSFLTVFDFQWELQFSGGHMYNKQLERYDNGHFQAVKGLLFFWRKFSELFKPLESWFCFNAALKEHNQCFIYISVIDLIPVMFGYLIDFFSINTQAELLLASDFLCVHVCKTCQIFVHFYYFQYHVFWAIYLPTF